MSIILAYLDYKTAKIDVREKFSFTSPKIRELLKKINNASGVTGTVLLCTCNRTELYVSGEYMEGMELVQLLCREAGITEKEILPFKVKYDKEAVLHLMEVACGLHSMVLCEDQIITQVREAARAAREEKVTDSVLETLFRLATTAAKKAKTEVRVKAVPGSAAENAISLLSKEYSFKKKKVLVIGNGEIGRLSCSKLMELGADVTVTLRKYKHGDIIIPAGCYTIPYDERAGYLLLADVVVSATTSPHFTITLDMIAGLERKPELFIDLSLPRDIEPGIAELPGVKCYNLDQLYQDYTEFNKKEIKDIKEIIESYCIKFEKWSEYFEIICNRDRTRRRMSDNGEGA